METETEIKFKRDTSFRKQFFIPESFSHPAKMDAQLLIWIVEKYTQVGETILDPMAGSGTAMLACTLGRNVVMVELEDKFCKMMAGNWNEVSMRPQLGSQMGNCQIIQGDARQLEGLLLDKCIFSPPFAEAQSGGGIAVKGYRGPKHGPTDLVGKRSYMPDNIGNSEGQIGNLPYGQIDKIVTCPPYEEAMGDKHHSPRNKVFVKEKRTYNTYTDRVDSIITSPPYSLTVQKGHEGVQAWKVIEGLKNADNKTLREKSKELAEKGIIVNQYGESPENIGNLKSDSYLEAMLQVYQQCYKVLKPVGLMILVTKNFIRNKQIIRLDTDTIKLCEQAGFIYLERHYRKLSAQSFWRTIYHQKHPEVEQINHEDVLVFDKN